MITIYGVIIILTTDYCYAQNKGIKTRISRISHRMPVYDKEWHYGQNWPSIGYNDCGQTHQSPIRIFSSTAIANNSLNFKLENYNKVIKAAFIENNGHTVQVGFSDKLKISIIGSATDNQRYMFEQLHFHWGSYDEVGSEHTIDGYRGPMELHLVHYKQSYGSFDEAFDKPDGLVVLSGIYKISSQSNKVLSPIIKLVKNVPKYEDKALILESLTLRSFLPKKIKPFYTYMGSITTPPCYQSVKWIIFKTLIEVSAEQEKQFRKLRGEYRSDINGRKKPISNNYRPLQAINERQIHLSN